MEGGSETGPGFKSRRENYASLAVMLFPAWLFPVSQCLHDALRRAGIQGEDGSSHLVSSHYCCYYFFRRCCLTWKRRLRLEAERWREGPQLARWIAQERLGEVQARHLESGARSVVKGLVLAW